MGNYYHFAMGQQTIARFWMSCQVVGELPHCGDSGCGRNWRVVGDYCQAQVVRGIGGVPTLGDYYHVCGRSCRVMGTLGQVVEGIDVLWGTVDKL